MADIDIKLVCTRCQGTGIDDHVKDGEGNPIGGPCAPCAGTGWKPTQRLEVDDLIDRFNDIDNKLDSIVEKVDEIKIVVDAL